MADTLTPDQFLRALERVLDRLQDAAEELGRLDAAMGDGDFGVSMTLGAQGLRKLLPDLHGQEIGAIVARCGMAFNSAAPSTIGALIAIGAMRAGKEAKGVAELDAPLLARMVRAAELGIKEKGRAVQGDKTLLDALGPAADALENAARDGKGLAEAVDAAVEAARAGVAATIPMKSRSGRGAWIAERTVGQQDPGATAVLLLWEAVAEYLRDTGH